MADRDPEKDALAIRADIFKQASTVSIFLATIASTFLLTGFKQLPTTWWILALGILAFITTAAAAVFTLSNMTYHVRGGQYGLGNEAKAGLRITQGAFVVGLVTSAIFVFLNLGTFAAQRKAVLSEEIRAYVDDRVDKVVAERLTAVEQRIRDSQVESERRIMESLKEVKAELEKRRVIKDRKP